MSAILRTHTAIRYVQPLREGGSLPAVVDTDGGGLFVVKFRGAGQGAKALVAELLVGEIARIFGLPVPELAVVCVPEPFGRSEPDPEIQDVLRKSHGVNAGMRYLDGAFNFDATAAGEYISAELAARIVWLDAFTTNPDRTHRNPNLLVWRREPWLIDHGAALYAHHDWPSVDAARTATPFPLIERHVLLARAASIAAADEALAPMLTASALERVLRALPDALLAPGEAGGEFPTADAARARYREYLEARLAARRAFVDEADRARERVVNLPPVRLPARR